MKNAEGVSFVVPCYREQPTVITATVASIIAAIGASAACEILVVNDGAPPETFPRFSPDFVRVIHHEVNRGYGSSLMTGVLAAQHEWIGIVDADGTYPVDRFKQFMEFTADHDMIVGRRDTRGIPPLRRLPKFLLAFLAGYLVDQRIPDLNSGMRLFRRNIVFSYRKLFPKRFSFTSTLTMVCLTNFYKVKWIPIPYFERIGASTIQPVRDTLRFFSLVFRLALYYRPLRFFLPLSGMVALLALLRAVRDVVHTNHFGGLTLVLFSMAFQIFFFGLIAEVVSKK